MKNATFRILISLLIVVAGPIRLACATPPEGCWPTESSAGQTSRRFDAYFLFDKDAVLGFGHAALLIGDAHGWHYFSFAPQVGVGRIRPEPHAAADNLRSIEFATLEEARRSVELRRYDKFLHWSADDAFAVEDALERARTAWSGTAYDPIRRNCLNMVADVLAAAGVNISAKGITPAAAYVANLKGADDHGDWPSAAPVQIVSAERD